MFWFGLRPSGRLFSSCRHDDAVRAARAPSPCGYGDAMVKTGVVA